MAAVFELSDPLDQVPAPPHPVQQRVSDWTGHQGGAVRFDMLARQAIASADAWAAERGTLAGPADILVVLLDQHSPSVVAALTRMGSDAGRLRRAALGILGLPDDYAPVALDPLPPAGTIDRPALDLAELPTAARAELEARQTRLPLGRIRRRSDWSAVAVNEQRAVLAMAARRGLTDDETYSLLHHHNEAVQRRAAMAAPGIVPEPAPPEGWVRVGHLTGRRRRLIPRGWRVWFGNRRVGMKVAWFRWTAQRY